MNEIHIDDYGWTINITIKDENGSVKDLSSCIEASIIFTKPDNTSITREAEFVTDGSDGMIKYVVQDGDIDTVGTWQIQASTTFSSSVLRSNIEKFKVYRNL